MLVKAKRVFKKNLVAEIFRFLVTGGMNTLLTIALYQLMVTYINPEISYAIAWLTGFVFIAIVYPTYVFRSSSRSVWQIILLALLYVFSFSLGLFLIKLVVDTGLNERLAVFVVLGITSSISFIGAKLLFRVKNKCLTSKAEG